MKLGIFLGLHVQFFVGTVVMYELAEYMLSRIYQRVYTLYNPVPYVGLGTEFRSEKIPRNRLGMISVIPRKKVLIPRHSEFRGRANSEAQNGTERNGIPRKN